MNRQPANRPLLAATSDFHGHRAASLPILAAFLLLGAAGVLAIPAQAADDSNAGQLTQTPTVTPQQLNAALSALAGGTNDTQVQKLISQLQSELAGGNYNGAASTLVTTEAVVTALMLILLGGRAFDRRSVTNLSKTALACLVVIVAHHFLASLGPARLAADAVIYVGLVVGSRAVHIGEVVDVVRLAIRQKTSYAG